MTKPRELKTSKKKKNSEFDDDDESILKKLDFHEKYGRLFDFFKNPFEHFERELALSFIFGAGAVLFVFIFYYLIFLGQEPLFDFFAAEKLADIFDSSFINSVSRYLKSAETIVLLLSFTFCLPFIYYSEKHQRKIDFAEEKIPSLLRDLSDLISGGLTLQESLIELSSQEFSNASDSFLPEIRIIGNKMKSGISFETCLEDLGRRYDSKLIQRAASVIDAAEKSGGKMGLSLNTAAFDLQEAVNMKKERQSNQNVYGIVLLISFLLFIGIMILLIRQFQHMSLSMSQSMMPESILETAFIIYHMLFIQSFFAGLTIGKFASGKAVTGLKYSFGMMFAVWITFLTAGVFF